MTGGRKHEGFYAFLDEIRARGLTPEKVGPSRQSEEVVGYLFQEKRIVSISSDPARAVPEAEDLVVLFSDRDNGYVEAWLVYNGDRVYCSDEHPVSRETSINLIESFLRDGVRRVEFKESDWVPVQFVNPPEDL